MAETYVAGTSPRLANPKRVKWAKWLLLKGGSPAHTDTLRQIMAKLLRQY